jgi:hypothetical protein
LPGSPAAGELTESLRSLDGEHELARGDPTCAAIRALFERVCGELRRLAETLDLFAA